MICAIVHDWRRRRRADGGGRAVAGGRAAAVLAHRQQGPRRQVRMRSLLLTMIIYIE